MSNEEWRIIPGFNGKYMASSLGRIKDIDYRNTEKEHIVPQFNQGKYKRVAIYDGEKQVKRLVHRLIALAFVSIPERLKHIPVEKLDVHHIDFGFSNAASNLCWLTRKEHQQVHNGMTVYQYGLDGAFIAGYKTAAEAMEKTGIDRRSIQTCCRGKIKTAGDFQWSYTKVDMMKPIKTRNERISETLCKQVILFNLDGTKDSEHESVQSAAEYLGVSDGCVSACCKGRQKTTGGYIARYK